MKLTKIKLAGFKSFVDPTTIPIPSNLVGIVGPNGCGKSNTIDAVRWVMGETSAKHLRGESMADVIFNGSNSRKPVGQAFVELIFDNSDGAAGGQYAHYGEISVKRLVTRDGQSNYYLNGTKCRRRDITDIFLGTGLGPRSYAIIEQGMISRVIEAKPEELRSFFEEAAGISKYKERRRETENRIRHTRDNLDRLSDLREELDKQLSRLERQSATAERYKGLKQEERVLKAELLALRYRAVDGDANARQQKINGLETALEAALAAQRGYESAIEKERDAHTEATDSLNVVQGRFYGVGAEIARVEQAIQHNKELKRRQEHELEQAERAWGELHAHIERDRAQLEELTAALAEDEPALELARAAEEASGEARIGAEERMQAWQEAWDDFNRRAAEPTQTAQVERSQIEHMERQMERQRQRADRLDEERGRLADEGLTEEIEELALAEAEGEEQATRLQEELVTAQEEGRRLRDENRELATRLDGQRGELQTARGRLASLEALQQAALGKGSKKISEWLKRQGLTDAPRLAQHLKVEGGWERAVETVLGGSLEAVCVDGFDAVSAVLESLEGGTLTFFDTTTPSPAAGEGDWLAAKVSGDYAAGALLAGVRTAASLEAALALRGGLAAHESVITPEGIWLGPSWLRVARDADEHAGVLAREQEIKELSARTEALQAAIDELTAQRDEGRARVQTLEERRDSLQKEAHQAGRRHAEVRSQLSARRARLEQHENRIRNLASEREEVEQQLGRDREELENSRMRLQEALAEMEVLAQQRDELTGERDRLRQLLEEVRDKARGDRDSAHQLAIRVEQRRTQRNATEQNLGRMDEQIATLAERREELRLTLSEGEEPVLEMEAELEELLARRVEAETALNDARKHVETVDHELRRLDQDRHGAERRVQEVRGQLEQARINAQELKVRRQTLEEQLAETDYQLDELFQRLPEQADIPTWEQRVEEVGQRISRLGPINLAAIDEFKEQQERKTYLDAQNADLEEALKTLEGAIAKIDRETRARFKETFDQVNAGIKELFPRLFGGGQAFLELTGEDLLDTGVSVMARPPGKNIRSIHLLSGGEKALTAVALVFSIFELNPAPFCMLDEVDAPLDDANVGRFSQLIKEKSDKVQFIFITHNKVTMEIADQLCGVTMHEPGVSRLVSVDVEEAAKLAAM
ncbi:chromosome segregation protein SMC [Endothiovibrio diazotrophicus]